MFQICFTALLRGNRAHVGTFKRYIQILFCQKISDFRQHLSGERKKPTKEDTDFGVLNLVGGAEPHNLFFAGHF